MSTISVIVPCVCPVCNMWLECSEVLLLFLTACVLLLCPVLNFLSVCPIYFNGQSRHLFAVSVIYIFYEQVLKYILYYALHVESYFYICLLIYCCL
jgi:hypothetical protein